MSKQHSQTARVEMRTPGSTTNPAVIDPPQSDDTVTADDAEFDGGPQERGADEPLTLTKGELQALLTRAAAAAVAGVRAAERGPGAADAPAALPDERDVDPARIDRMTLTKQGWVVPHGLAPAASNGIRPVA